MSHRLLVRSLALVIALGFLLPPGPAPGQQPKPKTGQEIYKDTLKATAWVVVPRGQPVNGVLKVSTGTGSLIDRAKRIVITNYHVVTDADKVFVFFPAFDRGKLVAEREYYQKLLPKGAGIQGTVIAKDMKRDLALIQLATLPDGVRVLPLAKASPSPGQRVHSIGNPGKSGALWVYTSGDVRQVYRKQWKAGEPGRILELDAHVVETQSPTNKGDSGGPLVNDHGQLVAVTQGSAAEAQLLSLFIDVSEVKALLAAHKIKVSGGGTTVVVEDKPKPEKPAVVLSAEDKAEQEAARSLSLAKNLADSGKIESARARYQEIVKKYPKTQAAEEARKLLKQ